MQNIQPHRDIHPFSIDLTILGTTEGLASTVELEAYFHADSMLRGRLWDVLGTHRDMGAVHSIAMPDAGFPSQPLGGMKRGGRSSPAQSKATAWGALPGEGL